MSLFRSLTEVHETSSRREYRGPINVEWQRRAAWHHHAGRRTFTGWLESKRGHHEQRLSESQRFYGCFQKDLPDSRLKPATAAAIANHHSAARRRMAQPIEYVLGLPLSLATEGGGSGQTQAGSLSDASANRHQSHFSQKGSGRTGWPSTATAQASGGLLGAEPPRYETVHHIRRPGSILRP